MELPTDRIRVAACKIALGYSVLCGMQKSSTRLAVQYGAWRACRVTERSLDQQMIYDDGTRNFTACLQIALRGHGFIWNLDWAFLSSWDRPYTPARR